MIKKVKIKRIVTWGLGLLFYLAISISPVNWFLPNTHPHRFTADQGKCYIFEFRNGRDPYGRVMAIFDGYKARTNQPNLKLYRNFHRKWWQVWNWLDFITHPRWRLPYVETDAEAL
jgi:hypothetical protein